jgi:hypothetical protein
MKRLLILVVAVLGLGASSYAQNDYDVLWVLNNKSTFETVAEYVNATSNQKEYMRAIFYDSTEKLKSALIDNDKEAAEKALFFNLANVRSVCLKNSIESI